MNRVLRIAIVFAGVLAVAAPALAAPNWPDSFSAYIGQVRKTIKTTDMNGYLAVVKNPNGAMLIDVREGYEYKAGHIPAPSTCRAACSNSRSGKRSAIRRRST